MTWKTSIPIGNGLERREYARGTWLVQTSTWGLYVAGRALCDDGLTRTLKRIGQTADTWFSVPASVTAHGKTVGGYITTDTTTGSSVYVDDNDPVVVRFHAYTYGVNGFVIRPCGPIPPKHLDVFTMRTRQGVRYPSYWTDDEICEDYTARALVSS